MKLGSTSEPQGEDHALAIEQAVQPASSVQSTSVSTDRILELDILRGLAILLVLGIHNPGDSGESGVLRPIDVVMHRIGWTGVDLFFVLSGFLIGGLLLNEINENNHINLGRFLVRRMLRIWPAFYCLVLIIIIRLSIEHHDVRAGFRAMWPALIHVQNYVGVPRTQLWSLAVEEHFYLLLPLVLWLLVRRRITSSGVAVIPKIGIGLVVGCLALRTVLVLTTTLDIRSQTYLCIDALFFGVTLAYLRLHRPHVLDRVAATRGLLVVAALLFTPAMMGGTVHSTVGYTAVYLCYALVLIRFTYREHRGPVLDRFVRSRAASMGAWIGIYSYSIYLVHFDAGWFGYVYVRRLAEAMGLPPAAVWLVHTVSWFAASIIGGVLIAKLIEVPVMRLRERLFPSSVTSAVPPTELSGQCVETPHQEHRDAVAPALPAREISVASLARPEVQMEASHGNDPVAVGSDASGPGRADYDALHAMSDSAAELSGAVVDLHTVHSSEHDVVKTDGVPDAPHLRWT